MKKSLVLLSGLALLAAVSCNKEPQIVYSENPVKSISVTSGTETVEGVVTTTDKSIKFTFNDAEDFSACDVTLELNEGWTLNYPTSLKGVNLQETPVFRFADHTNAVVRYTVSFSSNAFPIVDASKIQIKGLNAGEGFTVDNTTKTITIAFDESKLNFNAIELVFNEGALQEGVQLPENLVYDFAKGNAQSLVLKLGGDRVYTVKLNVDQFVTAPETMGFQDVSSAYVTADQSAIKVYSASRIANVPVFLLESADWSNWAGTWIKGGGWPSENAWYNGANAGDDLYAFPGDWAESRATMNCFGNLAIVTVDAGKVSADLKSATTDVDPTSFSSAIVTSGWVYHHGSQVDYLVRDNGVTVRTPEAVNQSKFRASVLVKDGVVSFATAGEKSDGFYVVPFQNDAPADIDATLNAASEKIEAPDIAWVQAWGVRDGKAMRYVDYINNDANNWLRAPGVLGMGYEGIYNVHNLVGTTYDGKLAFMINEGGSFSGDGVTGLESNGYEGYSNYCFKGYSLKQMLWIAKKLGWRNAAVLGTRYGEVSATFCPSLLVNGKSVIEGLTPTATTYVLAVDVK